MWSMIVGSSALIMMLVLMHTFLRGRIRASVLYGFWILVPIRLFVFPVLEFFFGEFLNHFRFSAVRGADQLVQWAAVSRGTVDPSVSVPARADLASLRMPWQFWVVWFLGFAGMAAWGFWVNERFRRKLFDTRVYLGVKGNYKIYKVPELISPCIFKVKGEKGIYLTEEAAEEKRREYVIAHELSHLRHRDLLWGKIRLLTLACFWFHPFVYLAAILSKRDCELACDERAIRELGEAKRKYYGEVLLEIVNVPRPGMDVICTATTMVSGKRELVMRLKNIAGGRKNRMAGIGAAALVFLVVIPVSFPSRADVRGLSPEETVRQALYYESQHDSRGLSRLWVDDSVWEDPDPLPFGREEGIFVMQAPVQCLSCREVEGDPGYEEDREDGYADRVVCLLEYVETDTIQKSIWTLVKPDSDSDWRISSFVKEKENGKEK